MITLQNLLSIVQKQLQSSAPLASRPLKVHAKGLKAGETFNLEFVAEDGGLCLHLTPTEEPEEAAVEEEDDDTGSPHRRRKGRRHAVPKSHHQEVREADAGEVAEEGK